jgi:hypothetical protein
MTTYRHAQPGETMNTRALAVVAITILPIACTPDVPAPTAENVSRPPRTSWGDPSIEGTYTNKDEFGTPFERPDELAGRRRDEFGAAEMAALMVERRERGRALAQTIGGSPTNDTGAGPPHWYEYLEAVNSRPWFVSEPADGKLPQLTEQGKERAQALVRGFAKRDAPDTYTDMGLYDRCITLGLPSSMMPMIYGNAYDITQAPGYVAIRYEMVHETRVIPLGDSPRVPSEIDFWMGDARGHWEGDTLVVETTNIREAAAYRGASENLKIIERFTPIDESTLSWEVRFEDPATWAAPWAMEMPLKRNAEATPFEYACHEGNLGLRNILSAARAAERAPTSATNPHR